MTTRRAGGDAGVSLIELGIVLPLLALIIFAILEFGFLWGDVNNVSRASQNAARTGSSLGNQRFADYESLRAVESTLAGLDGSAPKRVIIYRSTTANGSIPSSCLAIAATGTAPKGVSGLCNVYSPQQISSDNPGNFGSTNAQLTNCAAGAWDAAWCPTGRSRSLNNPDYLGVYVEVTYNGRTKIIPGTIAVNQKAVYQVEPCKAGETTCSSRSSRTRGKGDSGVTIAMVALLLIPMLAAAALAVDLGGWYARASEVQRTADAASLAGVTYLPQGITAARNEALLVAARNGYVNGVDGVSVTATDVGSNRLRVSITKPGVQQSVSSIFRDDVTVTRVSTAEYVQPVPMGSPRNYLGTFRTQGSAPHDPAEGIAAANQENFWLSVSGYCARREHGDRITPRTDSQGGGSFASCIPSGGSGASSVIANPEWTPDGYFYAIEFPRNYAGMPRIEIFDAPHCEGLYTTSPNPGDDGPNATAGGPGGWGGQRQYNWTLRSNSSLNPTLATVISGPLTISPSDCTTWGNTWHTLFNFPSNPTAGIYFLQIQPVVPTDQTGNDAQEGQNLFSLRVADPGGFTPCSSDPNIGPLPHDPTRNCPNIYGLTHLGVQAKGTGTNPSFFLASVSDQHSGKTMQIELFDTAEGANTIQLRDPAGADYPFTWEVACMDGSYRSEHGGSCATSTGEVAPPGGYGPVANVTSIDVSGANDAWRPWGGRNSQNGRYSDRIIRLTVRLPGHPASPFPSKTIAQQYGPLTWWRIAYSVDPGGVNDRTTWSVRILGDPVRLVPNS